MKRKLGVAELKKHFSEVLMNVSAKGEHFIIEKNGKPMAAIVDFGSYKVIENQAEKKNAKGLLAAIGAWDDFEDFDQFVKVICEARSRAKNRKIRAFDEPPKNSPEPLLKGPKSRTKTNVSF